MNSYYTNKLQNEVWTCLDEQLNAYLRDFPGEKDLLLSTVERACLEFLEQEKGTQPD